MKNPHKNAVEMSTAKWVWSTHKNDVLLTAILTLLFAGLLYKPLVGLPVVAIWIALNIARYKWMHKETISRYHNWEETFKFLKKEEE